MTNNKITDVKQFTKKPVTISAIQWTGENLPAVIEFTGKHPRWGGWFADMDEYVAHVRGDGNRFKIYTLEGVMDALPGDWIIRGVQGEHYPCKPDIFAATYEPAELQERRKADNQEPAGYHVIRECGKVGCSVTTLEEAEKTRDFWNKKWTIRPYFYAAPQPVPVVPEECPDELLAFCEQVIDSRITANAKADELWNACRTAMLRGNHRDLSQPTGQQVAEYEKIMLQGSQPVSDRDELPCTQLPCIRWCCRDFG